MKNKFLVFGLILALIVTIFTVVEISYCNEEENICTKSSLESDAVVKFQGKQEKKDVYVYITKTGKKYHRGNCRYLKKSKIKISLKDACKRGLAPCKVCKPPKCPEK